MIAWLVARAWGGGDRPVHPGDTVESIAQELGRADLADPIRELNGLSAGAQPVVGQILRLPPQPGPSADQQAFLFSATGPVTVRDPAGALARVETFRSIPSGSTVCTGAGGHAGLRIAAVCSADGAAADDIVLDPETCVVVDSAFASALGRSTLVTVSRGAVAVAPNPDAAGQITVRTASGWTSGASGGFRVHVEADAMRAEALTGPVAVEGAATELALAARQGSRVPTGEPPGPPVDLLAPPELVAPPEGGVLRRPSFAWQPGPDAFAYRLEFALNRSFTAVVFADTVPGPSFAPALLLLPDAPLWWRVASVDRFGYLGAPTEGRALRTR